MASTYRSLITGSLRLLGVVGDGETPSPYQAQNALTALNELIDAYNTAGMQLYDARIFTEPLTGGSSYTIGPAGNINIPVRPSRIAGAWIRDQTGTSQTDLPISVLSAAEWGDVRAKNTTSTGSGALYLDGNWPLATITLHPIPTQGTLVLLIYQPLTTPVDLDDPCDLPPAYQMALRAELAVHSAPEYGREASPTIQMMMYKAKNLIFIANTHPERLEFDAALLRGW